MAATKTTLLARLWALDVDTAVSGSATWTRVRGLSAINLTVDGNSEDDSDLDSGAWGSSTITQRSWTVELTGMEKKFKDGGATLIRDPGVEFLRAAGFIVGDGANVHIRFYQRETGGNAYEGQASVVFSPGEASTTGLQTFTITLAGQGELKKITSPGADVATP